MAALPTIIQVFWHTQNLLFVNNLYVEAVPTLSEFGLG